MSANNILSSVSSDVIEHLTKEGSIRVKKFGQGEFIHFEDDICKEADLVLSGSISVQRIDESGRQLTVATFYKDDIIGSNLLFAKDGKYPMNVISETSSEVLCLSKEAVLYLGTENPKILIDFIRIISDHSVIIGSKVKDRVSRTIRESILSHLKREIEAQGSNRVFLGTTKKSLAESFGISRTSLSRELQKMKKEGILKYDKDSITLLKRDL